jgi:hypothetical protein
MLDDHLYGGNTPPQCLRLNAGCGYQPAARSMANVMEHHRIELGHRNFVFLRNRAHRTGGLHCTSASRWQPAAGKKHSLRFEFRTRKVAQKWLSETFFGLALKAMLPWSLLMTSHL